VVTAARTPIFGLSIRQPWAHAIAWGTKRIENRFWSPTSEQAGAFVAIHAAKTIETGDLNSFLALREQLAPHEREWHTDAPSCIVRDLPLGAIVAVARIAGTTRSSESGWFCGPVGIVLDSVVPLDKPVPCRGNRGLFELPFFELEDVRAAWKRSREQGLHKWHEHLPSKEPA
jgi:hypothetical protein